MTDGRGWLGPTLAVVAAVTALRLAALALDRTDLFVDESQYWLWGQNLDFGYYSKPPLIAWLIRAVTDLAGSDAPFWVRMPGAVLHGATALILAALAARVFGARTAFWTGVAYVTAPFTAVGSLLISTDTVMAPAYAGALYGWFRLAETRAARFAALAGAAAGVAFMAKYAAVYFLLGAGLSAAVLPSMRVGWRNGALMVLAFAAIIAPNVIWNLGHDLTTVSHTMDNVGWVRAGSPLAGLNLAGLAGFALSQFAVFGPVLFLALALGWVRPAGTRGEAGWALLFFSLPILAIVTIQALLSKAYANWAVATYFAGTPIAVAWLRSRDPKLLWLSVAANGLICAVLALLTITAPWPDRNDAPLLKRYLGRADLSRQIIATANAEGFAAVYAGDRDILADLFYTGAASGLAFYATRPTGRARNYYEQMFALPADPPPTLYILSNPPACGGSPVAPVAEFDTSGGAYAKRRIAAYRLPEECSDAP